MDERPKYKTKTIKKPFEENIGRTLFEINHSKIFFDLSPRVTEKQKQTNGT